MAHELTKDDKTVRIFLGGDVMTGRAIDQLFAVHNADDFGKPDHIPAARYQNWSAALHGAETRPLRHDYIWGSALGVLDTLQPDFRLANLETAITTSDKWEEKAFNYRMHPANVGCLSAGELDCVALANNHVLDFGSEGLIETIATLREAGIGYCGSGMDDSEASRPYVHHLRCGKRILVFSWGVQDSGITSPNWRAGPGWPGVNHIARIDAATATEMGRTIAEHRRDDDLVIASLHWGANWVAKIPDEHRKLARDLIDEAGVDIVHGHSAHHVMPTEIYRGKLILYGCGDLIGDAEGRPDTRKLGGHLGALYFADLDVETHRLKSLRVHPVERRRFRLELPSREDVAWIRSIVSRRSA